MDFSARNSVKVGENKQGIFDFKGKKVNFYKLKVGTNKFNIIPFNASANNPLVKSGVMKKGNPDYGLILSVHKYIGVNKDTFVCPTTYGKACPICEAAKQAYDSGDAVTGKALKAKQMVYYNIVNPLEDDKGVQLFEFNSWEFERIIKAVDNSTRVDPDEVGYTHFADTTVEGGRYVKIEATSDPTPNGKERAKPSSISLTRRREPTDEYLSQIVQLDDLVKVLSYEELENVLTGVGNEAPEEEVPEEEVEEKPAPKAKAPAEEDEPVVKKEEAGGKCPSGHKYGKDWGECKECDSCFEDSPTIYKACRKASRE
jgi:hypothetical protein